MSQPTCAAIPAIASGRDTRPIASSTGNEITQRNGSTSATTLAGPGRTSIGAPYPEKMNTAKYSRLIAVTRVVQDAAIARVHSTGQRKALASNRAGTDARRAQGSVVKVGLDVRARTRATGSAATKVRALKASPIATSRWTG